FHWNVERKLRHPNRAPGVGPLVGTEDLDDEIGEAVDDGRLPIEAGRRIDHAEDADPCCDPVEAAELAPQACEDGQARQTRREIRLLLRHLAPHFPEWLREGAIRV